MRDKEEKRKWRKIQAISLWILIIVGVSALGYNFLPSFLGVSPKGRMTPEEVFEVYTRSINEKRYEEIYSLLNEESKNYISEEEFISKNKKIYEGIEASKLTINITESNEVDKTHVLLHYDTQMNTLAGEISFSNQVILTRNKEKEYQIRWYPQLIFPMLNPDDKVRVNTLKGERGSILDRNGEMLAGEGVVSSIGLVPGKMGENKEEDIGKIAELLDVSAESINKKLGASYVK